MSSVLNHSINPSLTEVCFAAGSGAVAALALSNPVGAFGGAIVGTAGALGAISFHHAFGKIFHADKNGPGVISKVLSAVAGFFASAGAVFGVSSVTGHAVTFVAACTLSAATFAIALGVFSLAAMTGVIVHVCRQPHLQA
ncbi:MAG: hypothetical protein WDZ27_00105 [Waddliaceae bacterium]